MAKKKKIVEVSEEEIPKESKFTEGQIEAAIQEVFKSVPEKVIPINPTALREAWKKNPANKKI